MASAESDLTSSNPRPENGAAAASWWVGSNIGRNAAATPARTVSGPTKRKGANTPQLGPSTPSGPCERCWTSTDSPLTTASTPTTESSHDRRKDGVAASRATRWSGTPIRPKRRPTAPGPLRSQP